MIEQIGLTAKEGEQKKPILEIDEKTRAQLTALFRGEEWNGEKFPPVFLKLFFSPHRIKENMAEAVGFLEEADVYAPEIFSWDEMVKRGFQELSNGNIFFETGNEFNDSINGSIYNTHKTIVFADVSEDAIARHPEIYQPPMFNEEDLKQSSYEDAILEFNEFLNETAKSDLVRRERYIVRNFAENIKKAFSENPELKKKDGIKVLMTLGSGHSALYHLLKDIGGNHVSRNFHDHPKNSFILETLRRVAFKKDVPLKLKERALCEEIFRLKMEDVINNLSKKTEKNEYFYRYLVTLFSAKEMRSLFDEWSKGAGNWEKLFASLLEQKNIVFPKNEKEMDEILADTSYGKYQKILKEKKQQNGSEKK
jgi:hypothetical protein